MSAEPAPVRLGVYGGSFDPIHNGHLVPVEETSAALGIDRVLFIPAFSPPHKPSGPSASSHHRFAMAALALSPFERFILSDFEVGRGGTTYTVETLRHLRARETGTEIVLMVGSDTLATLESWRSYREIVESYRIAVVFREPYDFSRLEAELPAELSRRLAPPGSAMSDVQEGKTIFWGGNRAVTISSTWIRRAIPAGENLSGKLPPPVEKYLRREKLYLTE